jgi:RND family efflux transporter MFP subunit
VQAQAANVQVQEANVRRLETLQSFQKVTAPFAGVITARNVEVGALITAGSSTTSRELFRLAQIDTLRVFVNVPQTLMNAIQPGHSAQLMVRELPQQVFTGKVVRTTSALDVASRTLPMEVQVSNPELTLLPGMYAQVKFNAPRATPPLKDSAVRSNKSSMPSTCPRTDASVHPALPSASAASSISSGVMGNVGIITEIGH